jgi:hypothetical protein
MAQSKGINIGIPFDPVRFDVNAFNDFIKANGVQLYHYKAVVCPIGYTDIFDVRNAHSGDHHSCENGYIYKFAGVVTASFTNNAATTTLTDAGLLDGSVVYCTFPQFYNDQPDKPVYVQLYDRFFIKDCAVLVPNTQRVQSNITGIDKLTYKAKYVEYIIDSNNTEYGPSDYTLLENGMLKWSSNRPPFNSELNKGAVYSIRYLYVPFFYASKLVHEVRIANQSLDFTKNTFGPVRVPYACLLSREFVSQKAENDPENPNNNGARTIDPPSSGSFSTR